MVLIIMSSYFYFFTSFSFQLWLQPFETKTSEY